MKKGIKVAIIAGAVAVALGLASPLFYSTQVDEPLPILLDTIEPGLTLEKFGNMDDSDRKEIVEKMPPKVREMIMIESSKNEKDVSEGMEDMAKPDSQVTIVKSGNFEGLAGHYADGLAKIIQVGDATYLRFENFEVTNGPDLRVYLTPGGDVKKGIHLEKLKGSKGDQNYLLENIDISEYDTAVVYCQPFGVYFGQAKLA